MGKRMSRWKITGANRETGETHCIWIEAARQSDAQAVANSLGILVSSVVDDPAETRVVAELPNRPIEVVLKHGQINKLNVSSGRIAVGVFLGLLLWAGVCFLATVFFWGVLAAAIAGAA